MSKNGRGEGSIVHRKDGRWQGMVSCGYKPDGSLNRKYFYGKTRAEAADKVQRALAELKDGTFIDKNTNPTVEAWLNEWLWTYKKNSLKPTTFEQYETLIRMHIVPAVGQKKLIELSVRDLQILYNFKTGILSARSVRLMNIILHGALEQANLLGLVNRNVTKGVVLPKEEPKEMRVLTLDEQRKLIEILKTDRYGNAYLFGLCTGLRRGELLAFTWDDYDAANKTIYVNKTLNRVKNYADDGRGRTKLVITSPKTMKSRRLVPLMDLAIEALNRQREYQKADKELLDELYRDDNLIFCGEMGNIIDPGNFNRKFGKFLELAGIDGATPHTMRHSFATRGLESGISIKIMQELLGHSSINVTGNIYTHVLLETKKGEIDKLNKMFPASNGETEIE